MIPSLRALQKEREAQLAHQENLRKQIEQAVIVDTETAYAEFCSKHFGVAAEVRRDVYVDSQSNRAVLASWLRERSVGVNSTSLERAFSSCKHLLSNALDTAEVASTPQPVRQAAPKPVPFTAEQIRAMSRNEFRQLVRAHGWENVNAVLDGKS